MGKIYDYKDEAGTLLYQAIRTPQPTGKPKWTVRRPDGNGGFIFNLDNVRRIPYRLQDLLQASHTDTVFIVEGEKDTDRLYNEGLVGTTNSGGANAKWDDSHSEFCSDRKPVIIPDNDEPGMKHAMQVKKSFAKIGINAPILTLPGVGRAGDVSDWLNNGGTKDLLLEMAREARPKLNLLNMVDVKDKVIEWFRLNELPAATTNLLQGEVGEAKTFMTSHDAAKVSTGGKWLDGSKAKKGSVLIFNDEDPPERIRERLAAHGADMSKISIVSSVGKKKDYFDITKHRDFLENTLIELSDCRLLILDPITAYLGNVNANSNNEVRAALGPLSALAAKHNVTVIMVNHLNKKADLKHIHRGLGSTAFTAVARSVWVITRDADDKDLRIFSPVKTNYSINPAGHKFRIINGAIQFEPEPFYGDIDDKQDSKGQFKRSDEAVEWLREKLQPGCRLSETIFIEAQEDGFNKDLMYKAKGLLKVVASKEGFGPDGKWFWRLPDE